MDRENVTFITFCTLVMLVAISVALTINRYNVIRYETLRTCVSSGKLPHDCGCMMDQYAPGCR